MASIDSLSPTTTSTNDRIHALIYHADALVDYGREMLHAYPYREVPSCWREFYTDAGILKALALGFSALRGRDEGDGGGGLGVVAVDVEPLKVAIAVCDNVLVMAGATGERRKDLVFEMIDYLEAVIESGQDQKEDGAAPMAKRQKVSEAATTPTVVEGKVKLGEEPVLEPIPEIRFPIPRIHLPTMEEFQHHVNGGGVVGAPGGPIIITGGIDHWPARERWTDLDTLCRTAGPDRLVPIEIGSQYTDEQWTQKLVTMREFIQAYILRQEHSGAEDGYEDDGAKAKAGTTEIGYLAQHDLFAQIPRLRRDIDIPDYCMIGPNDQEGYNPPDDVLLNAWFGPRGTVSPMHTDPYHNLLAQVVGRKYIRLYAPKETFKLYCYGNESQDDAEGEGEGEGDGDSSMLGNTSQVNVEEPDLVRHPRFAEAEYLETVLAPGELLYIPFQWWHYIRSLSTSFSVSFWF